jgi:hypothetical protein
MEPSRLQNVLLTQYPPGAAIGWHKDRSVFGQVVGISLLSACTFRFRRQAGQKWERSFLIAEPKSAYLLDGPARTTREHSIPAVEALRYSVTFPWQNLIKHYHRQREYFYHAESLRNFARDTVPSGTFEDLQDEVHSGVVEVESAPHPDGLVRMNAVTQAAAQLPLSANGLINVTKVQDKRGICHQLANEDRLTWKK